MADPQHLDFLDWAGILLGSLVSGVLAAMGWFAGKKRILHERITRVEETMKAIIDPISSRQIEHATKLAVLETQRLDERARLTRIEETISMTSQKIDGIMETMMELLMEVKTRREMHRKDP